MKSVENVTKMKGILFALTILQLVVLNEALQPKKVQLAKLATDPELKALRKSLNQRTRVSKFFKIQGSKY